MTSYELQLLQDGLRDWQPIMKLEKSARSCTVKTLEPNTSYQFRVLAINEHGYSDPSDSTDVVRTKGTCARVYVSMHACIQTVCQIACNTVVWYI